MTITHELKVHHKFFYPLFSGNKTFEVRKNDRNYKLGDILVLRDYDNIKEKYLDGYIIARVTYILIGGEYGIDVDYICMSFDIISKVESSDLPL